MDEYKAAQLFCKKLGERNYKLILAIVETYWSAGEELRKEMIEVY